MEIGPLRIDGISDLRGGATSGRSPMLAKTGAKAAILASAAPREVGVTTSSFFRQMYRGAADRYFSLEELPRVLRDELGMRIIDVNTGTLGGMEPQRLDSFRAAGANAGCVLTNVSESADAY